MGLSRGVISLTFQFLLYIWIEGNTEKDQFSGFFVIGHILDCCYSVFSHIFEAFIFQHSVSWDVLDSCLVSKLPVLFPIAAAKSATFWWAFALLYLERDTSWRGVTGAVLKVRKMTLHHFALWFIFGRFGFVFWVGFFSFPWERKL